MLALRLWAAALARRAGFLAVGIGLFLLGAIFLLMAIWIALAAALGPLLAALTLALLCFGVGMIVLWVARMPYAAAARVAATAPPPREAPQAAWTTAALMEIPLIQAFVIGLRAGARNRSR